MRVRPWNDDPELVPEDAGIRLMVSRPDDEGRDWPKAG